MPIESAYQEDFDISRSTVWCRLLDQRLKCHRPATRPRLQEQHKAARMHWARQHLPWTTLMWNQAMFPDQQLFKLEVEHSRQRHHMLSFQWWNCFLNFNRGYRLVIVWGGIIGGRETGVVSIRLTSELYIREILEHTWFPFLEHTTTDFYYSMTMHQLINLYWCYQSLPAISPDMTQYHEMADEKAAAM